MMELYVIIVDNIVINVQININVIYAKMNIIFYN